MSNFACQHCGAICSDTPRGYVTGCVHYPPDIKPLRGFGQSIDIETGTARKWYIDEYGQKRWADDDSLFYAMHKITRGVSR
jgi:hypothetical protein